jgi:hypothetical protein
MASMIDSARIAVARGCTFKRCQCPVVKDEVGRRIPCLIEHGSWSYIADVGVDEATGKRKQVKRGGFPRQSDAQDALTELLALFHVADRSRSHSRAYWLAAAQILREDTASFELSGVGDAHVYVVRATQYLKIGYSKHPSRRATELSWNKGGDLIEPVGIDRRTCILWLETCGSRADERLLHWVARNYWAAGEWFYADKALVDTLPDLMNHRGELG